MMTIGSTKTDNSKKNVDNVDISESKKATTLKLVSSQKSRLPQVIILRLNPNIFKTQLIKMIKTDKKGVRCN